MNAGTDGVVGFKTEGDGRVDGVVGDVGVAERRGLAFGGGVDLVEAAFVHQVFGDVPVARDPEGRGVAHQAVVRAFGEYGDAVHSVPGGPAGAQGPTFVGGVQIHVPREAVGLKFQAPTVPLVVNLAHFAPGEGVGFVHRAVPRAAQFPGAQVQFLVRFSGAVQEQVEFDGGRVEEGVTPVQNGVGEGVVGVYRHLDFSIWGGQGLGGAAASGRQQQEGKKKNAHAERYKIGRAALPPRAGRTPTRSGLKCRRPRRSRGLRPKSVKFGAPQARLKPTPQCPPAEEPSSDTPRRRSSLPTFHA